MEDYGIKGVTDAEPGKEKLLNGPGLPDAVGKMGVIQGGGQWPNRLVVRRQTFRSLGSARTLSLPTSVESRVALFCRSTFAAVTSLGHFAALHDCRSGAWRLSARWARTRYTACTRKPSP